MLLLPNDNIVKWCWLSKHSIIINLHRMSVNMSFGTAYFLHQNGINFFILSIWLGGMNNMSVSKFDQTTEKRLFQKRAFWNSLGALSGFSGNGFLNFSNDQEHYRYAGYDQPVV